MGALRHGLAIGVLTGVVLASGLAVAEVSKEPSIESTTTFEFPRSFTTWPSPSPAPAVRSGGGSVAGDASVLRTSPAAPGAAPATGLTGRTFQSDYPSLGR